MVNSMQASSIGVMTEGSVMSEMHGLLAWFPCRVPCSSQVIIDILKAVVWFRVLCIAHESQIVLLSWS